MTTQRDDLHTIPRSAMEAMAGTQVPVVAPKVEKTAEAAKYVAFGPNHGGAFRPFDCGRTT